jgi:hypothetical protein
MRVLVNSTHNPNSILFGITGDIDNLGIYVAKNGRAKAENLVDLFNQIIRNESIRWARAHNDCMDDMTFIASGEEIVILGICRDRTVVDDLFHNINANINRLLRDNHFIDIGETGISFGCAIFADLDLIKKIAWLAERTKNFTGENEFILYLEIMEQIRNILAKELDKIKFKDLWKTSLENEILYRNFVYAYLLDYKYNTARALRRLAAKVGVLENKEQLSSLRYQYGLTDQNRRIAFELKEQIDNLD